MLYFYAFLILAILAALMFWLAYWVWTKVWWWIFTLPEHRELFLRAFELKTADRLVCIKHGEPRPNPRDVVVNFCLHVIKRWGPDADCLEPQFAHFFEALRGEEDEDEEELECGHTPGEHEEEPNGGSN